MSPLIEQLLRFSVMHANRFARFDVIVNTKVNHEKKD
jgi:hypothetical protein